MSYHSLQRINAKGIVGRWRCLLCGAVGTIAQISAFCGKAMR